MKRPMMQRLWLSIATSFLLLLFIGVLIPGPSAADVSGTWTSRVPGEGAVDETAPCTFHYDVTLTLTGTNSISGSMKTITRKVDVNMAGWDSCRDSIGHSETNGVTGTESGSTFTMKVHTAGGTYTFNLKVSGDRMTGGGSYVDASNTLNTWTFDLIGGKGGPRFFPSPEAMAYPASGVAFVIGGISLVVSFVATPMHGVHSVTGVTAGPARPGFKPGAPVSSVKHMGYMWDIPQGARPIPTDHPMLKTQQGQQTDTLQKIPCPFCGSPNSMKIHLGSWYCTNMACPWNNPPRTSSHAFEPTNVEPSNIEPKNVEPSNIEPKNVDPSNIEPKKIEPTEIKRP